MIINKIDNQIKQLRKVEEICVNFDDENNVYNKRTSKEKRKV